MDQRTKVKVTVSVAPGDQSRLAAELTRRAVAKSGPLGQMLGRALASALESLGDDIDDLTTKEAERGES